MAYPDRQLLASEIYEALDHIKSFLGVFSRDKLPNLNTKRTFSLIINLDDSRGPGTHWTAVFNNAKSPYLYYFDSFGVGPPAELRSNKPVISNDQQLQALRSSACGYYCIDFIKSMYRGMLYSTFVLKYTNDQKRNESILMQRVKVNRF